MKMNKYAMSFLDGLALGVGLVITYKYLIAPMIGG